MMNSGIAWCHDTLNVWIGCFKVSEGCTSCYAEVSTPVRTQRAAGHELWGKGAERYETKSWERNLRSYVRAAVKSGERRRIFAQSLSDTFEDRPDLVDVRGRFLAAVDALRGGPVDLLLLTKRPQNVTRMVPPSWLETLAPGACAHCGVGGADPEGVHHEAECRALCGIRQKFAGPCGASHVGWPAHVWIGATAENQARLDERAPHLLRIPAAVRFLSIEPQTEAISFDGERIEWLSPFKETDAMLRPTPRIHWVITGGESGSKARPFDLAWMRSIVEQCRGAGVHPFCKQMGAKPVMHGEPVRLVDNAGADREEWPAGDWPQEFPGSAS